MSCSKCALQEKLIKVLEEKIEILDRANSAYLNDLLRDKPDHLKLQEFDLSIRKKNEKS